MILTSLMIISVLLILYSIVYRYYITNTKYLKNVPGPKPNAIFGNLLSFFGPSEGWLPQLTEFIQTFGPVVKGYYGPYKLVLMVAEEKFLKYVLCSPNFIDKSDEYIIFENWLGKGLFTSSGPKWRARRRMLAPVFHNTILMNSVDTCNRLGEIFIRKLTKEVGKESFDILPQSSLLSLDIVCETIMGISMNVQESGNLQYVHSIDTLCRILMERYSSYIHNSLYPFTLIYWRERRAIKVIDEYTNTVIDKKIEKMNSIDSEAVDNSASRKLDLLDLLLKNTEDGTSLSRNDLRDEVVAFIFGGYHTTSSAISFVMYCLGENPEVQQIAFEEQMEIFDELSDAQPTFSDLQKMKYLEMVIKETLRLYPPVPFFARKSREDFEYGGNLYPKGLSIWMLPYLTHRNPEYFPEPLKFIPERFEKVDVGNSFIYSPFCAGSRSCMGRGLAMIELKSVISKVLRNFEIVPATPKRPLILSPDIVLTSKNGVNISIRRRDNNSNILKNKNGSKGLTRRRTME